MNFELSPEHAALRARARAFADKMRPAIAVLDDESRFPAEHLGELAALGLLTPHWPEAGDTLSYALVLEELARVSPAHAIGKPQLSR